ncbi:MAG: hypothetical protein HYR84_04795, partial [Planctomycetes bacterium]|nr:hypothetical protein [Planctomycetota bacterium]
MSTAVETRKNSSKSESYLQRKFDELAARIHRIDLAAHLLVLLFVVLGYGFLVTFFDSMVGTAATLTVEATRWTGFAAFIAIFALALIQTCRCAFASVNPYYVAHLLEQTMPDAKNGLVNWLDLHDEVMPSAFQKNLSARAAEQWKDADVDQCISTRGNWLFLAVAALPALGLAVFLILNPPALGGSLLRAFLPWYAPPPTAQTRITMLQPSAGDAEVKAKQSLTIVAKI